MVEFNVNEIPEGKSSVELKLDEKQVDLDKYEFQGGLLKVLFERTHEAIRIHFKIQTELTLVCDRSLEPFPYKVDRDYEILFEIGGRDDTEDELVSIHSLHNGENKIDIEKEIRDTILLGIPIKKLHPRFLDDQGNPGDFQKLYGDEDIADPRWEILKSLKKDN